MKHPQGLWIFVLQAHVLSKTAEKSGLRFPSCVRLPHALEVLVVRLYGGKRKKGFPPFFTSINLLTINTSCHLTFRRDMQIPLCMLAHTNILTIYHIT